MGPNTPRLYELDDLDDATATLIVELHNRDIEELLSVNKGKSRDGEYSDADFAIATYQDDLQKRNTVLADRYMSQSLTRAVISDAELLNESLTEENSATVDRALAYQLAGLDAPSAAPEQTTCALDDDIVARLAALYVSGRNDEGDDLESSTQDESSAMAASRGKLSSLVHRQCIACGSSKPNYDVLKSPCGHHYCQDCLCTLYELSTTDETLFPPRCCRQEIPLKSVKLYLSSTLIQTFEEKTVEFKTSDRTYCSQPACSSFITLVNIVGERATCTACGTHTCTICKNNAHEGDCPEDTAIQQVLETAREQGWQRCYSCRRLVELDIGCNHIVCHCSAEFCYICGEHWKTCPCDQWNEDRLMARANQVIARGRAQVGEARDRQVDLAVANLRERHDCAHGSWRYIPGPHRCEECYHNLPQYIFECRQCRIMACNRCKRNRL